MEKNKEYILCTAILKKEIDIAKPDIYNCQLGYRHSDIIAKFKGEIPIDDGQGFFTSKGRFVDRYVAANIAYKAGQISEKLDKLFSEDLY